MVDSLTGLLLTPNVRMQHYKIVLPADLNDYGSLFGGTLLKWIDEIAYIRVSLDFPGKHFVTVWWVHTLYVL